jgi:hypothetical protein
MSIKQTLFLYLSIIIVAIILHKWNLSSMDILKGILIVLIIISIQTSIFLIDILKVLKSKDSDK